MSAEELKIIVTTYVVYSQSYQEWWYLSKCGNLVLLQDKMKKKKTTSPRIVAPPKTPDVFRIENFARLFCAMPRQGENTLSA